MTASVLKVNGSPPSSKEQKLLRAEKEQKDPTITPLSSQTFCSSWGGFYIFSAFLYVDCTQHPPIDVEFGHVIFKLILMHTCRYRRFKFQTACISAGSLPLTSLCHEDTRSPGRIAPSSFFLDGSWPTVTSIWEINVCCYRLWDCLQDWGPGVFAIVVNVAKLNHTNLFLPLLRRSHRKILYSSKTSVQ